MKQSFASYLKITKYLQLFQPILVFLLLTFILFNVKIIHFWYWLYNKSCILSFRYSIGNIGELISYVIILVNKEYFRYPNV